MSDRNATVGLRLLAPFTTALGTGDPNSLQNYATHELPDQALAMVQDQGTLYRFIRAGGFTSAQQFDPSLVTPTSGPGQWVALVGQEASLAFAYQIGMNNASGVTVADPSNWSALGATTTWTVEDAPLTGGILVPTAFWETTSPSAGVLTYSGPPSYFRVSASVVLANAEGSNVQIYGLYISKNGTGLGAATEYVREMQQQAAAAQDPTQVTAETTIFMSPTETLQIAIINRAVDGDDVSVSRAMLAVELA